MTAAAAQTAGFDAIVLTGGRATRLGGADKPGQVVAGSTIIGSVIAAVTAAGARNVVLVGPARAGPTLARPDPPGGLCAVAEDPPGAGPVPAIRRGLAEVRAPAVAVLAADLPFLRAGQILLLLRAAGLAGAGSTPGAGAAARAGVPGSRDPAALPGGAVLTDDTGRPQWLLGCWRTTSLREAALAYSGASLHGLLRPLRPVLVGYELRPGEAPPWFDCDTAEDLRQARRWAAEPTT